MTIPKPLTLEITEIFKSIQGETSYSGLPTTFVRLSRCNLRCSWCDSKYSFAKGENLKLELILDKIKENAAPYVCITGGEPLLQKAVHPLMKELCDLNYNLSIETGGSLSIKLVDPRVKIILDIKCPKSGMSDRNNLENLELLKKDDEVKFVIADERDYQFAVDLCHKFDLFKKINNVLFSNVYDFLEPVKLVNWILRDNLKVRLNMQIHKYIWHPETVGV
jgi:7-carboxy-7-deazaguanine synthase